MTIKYTSEGIELEFRTTDQQLHSDLSDLPNQAANVRSIVNRAGGEIAAILAAMGYLGRARV